MRHFTVTHTPSSAAHVFKLPDAARPYVLNLPGLSANGYGPQRSDSSVRGNVALPSSIWNLELLSSLYYICLCSVITRLPQAQAVPLSRSTYQCALNREPSI